MSFDHLNGINLPHHTGSIDLILGVQYSHLHAESEKTKLGWHLIGSNNVKNSITTNLTFAKKSIWKGFTTFRL